MRFKAFIFAAVMAVVASIPQARSADFRGSPEDTFAIYSSIPFIRGADFKEYTEVGNQTRGGVRGELVREFMAMAKAMGAQNNPSGELAQSMGQLLLTFDSVYDLHRDVALQGVPASLEAQFRSELDAIYREARVAQQKIRFLDQRVAAKISARVREMLNSGIALTPTQRQELAADIIEIGMLPYGVFTVLGGDQIRVDLTLVKLTTGEAQSFSASDSITTVMRSLARQVFQYFQQNQYDPWNDPQPKLKWLLPAPTHRGMVLPQVALAVCKSQGARLPYAQELFLAAAAGEFHAGGIPFDQDSRYLVADHTRWDGQHFYYPVTGDPRGPVRTSAGTGSELGMYLCVKGAVGPEIQRVEKIFANIRVWNREEKNYWFSIAAECLLNEIGSISADASEFDIFKPCSKLKRATPKNASDFLAAYGIRL